MADDVVGLRRCGLCGRVIGDSDEDELECRKGDAGKGGERARRGGGVGEVGHGVVVAAPQPEDDPLVIIRRNPPH